MLLGPGSLFAAVISGSRVGWGLFSFTLHVALVLLVIPICHLHARIAVAVSFPPCTWVGLLVAGASLGSFVVVRLLGGHLLVVCDNRKVGELYDGSWRRYFLLLYRG